MRAGFGGEAETILSASAKDEQHGDSNQWQMPDQLDRPDYKQRDEEEYAQHHGDESRRHTEQDQQPNRQFSHSGREREMEVGEFRESKIGHEVKVEFVEKRQYQAGIEQLIVDGQNNERQSHAYANDG